MNYEIIKNEAKLKSFIEWLPELQENETFYLCLFARSKYCKNEDGSNKFPHIKTDKSQLKRLTVSKKELIIDKIRQLEVALGAYKTKDGADVPQEALALYITPNPRSQQQAVFALQRRLIDIQQCKGSNFNVHAEALSAIQKSCSREIYMDFDFDVSTEIQSDFCIKKIHEYLNDECINILKTRGGFYLLVELSEIYNNLKNTWYKNISSMEFVDMNKNDLIPVGGTYQGGFVPYFV